MEDLGKRTKSFSLRIIRLFSALPRNTEAQVIGKQLLRSGTSIGAHYAESVHARSDQEFTAKIDGGLQELSETRYWLELLDGAKLVTSSDLEPVLQEVKELTAIFVAISKKTKERRSQLA